MNLDLLKLAQIFNPGTIQSPMNPNPGVIMDGPDTGGLSGMMDRSGGQSNEPDLMTAIKELLSPKDTQFGRFEDAISAMPNRADYKPSKTRQVLAAIAGMGSGGPVGISGGQPIGYQAKVADGLKVRDSIRDESYNRALTDWSDKLDPLSKIAQMEQNRNVGNRATGIGILQRKSADDKLAHTIEVDADKTRQADEKIGIQRDRAETYIKAKEFAMQHPNYKTVTDENGEIVFWNPQEPTKIIRSGINSGDIGDIQKSELKVEGDLKSIAARGAESRKTGAAKDWEVYTNDKGETIRYNPSTNQTEKTDLGRVNKVSGLGGSAKPDNPSQQRTARALKATDLKIEHPEWAKWIKVNKGEVSVDPPSNGGFFSSGPDAETHKAITEALGLKSDSPSSPLTLKPEPPRTLEGPIAKGSEVGDPKRADAVKILQAAGKPLTNANIENVIKQLQSK